MARSQASKGTGRGTVSGKTIAVRENYSFVENVAAGTLAYNGAVYISTSPGEGVVIQDTGKVIFDSEGEAAKVVGPHRLLETDAEIFCTALS